MNQITLEERKQRLRGAVKIEYADDVRMVISFPYSQTPDKEMVLKFAPPSDQDEKELNQTNPQLTSSKISLQDMDDFIMKWLRAD